MARELVDVQVQKSSDHAPVGDRYTTQVDHTDPADVRGLFRDAMTHVGTDAGRHEIRVWRRKTGERLFTYSQKTGRTR